LTKLEKELAGKPWRQVREHLRVKLLPREGEVHVLAESGARTGKERGMRRRKLKALWQRLKEIRQQDLTRDQRLEKLGGARDRAGRAVAGLVKTAVDAEGKLTFSLDRAKLRTVRQREGRYLLRTKPSGIWSRPAASAFRRGRFNGSFSEWVAAPKSGRNAKPNPAPATRPSCMSAPMARVCQG
jgi:hypothetical protein